jgi:hypothetical protein
MPQQVSPCTTTVGNLVVVEQFEQVVAQARLVVIDVAGGEHGDLAGALGAVANRMVMAGSGVGAKVGRVELGQFAARIDAERLLQHDARRAELVGGIHHLRHHGNRGQGADQFGGGQQLVAEFHLAGLVLDRLGAQHGVREIQVPLVRRHVGALGHVADVAQVALVDDLPEFFLGHAGGLKVARLVDQVEQQRERIAQRDAAATAVADVEDALQSPSRRRPGRRSRGSSSR